MTPDRPVTPARVFWKKILKTCWVAIKHAHIHQTMGFIDGNL
jgi:hypothetical protein